MGWTNLNPLPLRHAALYLAYACTVRVLYIVNCQIAILVWIVGERVACRDAATTRMVAMTVQVLDKSVDSAATESRIGLLEEGAEVPITSNVFTVVILAVQGNVIVDESVYIGI